MPGLVRCRCFRSELQISEEPEIELFQSFTEAELTLPLHPWSGSTALKVPSKAYQVKTEHLKDGVVAINFSENKNFEPTVKDKASIYVPGIGKATIVLLQRNLMRLKDMQTCEFETSRGEFPCLALRALVAS